MLKNLIFDFGNVLFDLDLGQIEKKLATAFGENFEQAKAKLYGTRIFELYEIGGISTEEFVETIRHAASPPISPDEVVAAWNGIFLDFPKHRLEMLLRLRERFSVFLLSNINELHEKYVADFLRREHGIEDFETKYFDGVYYSHLIRLRKPDREIFEYVLADAELVAEECVFFDDLPENVEAARRVGIRGILHPVGFEIMENVQRTLEIDKIMEHR